MHPRIIIALLFLLALLSCNKDGSYSKTWMVSQCENAEEIIGLGDLVRFSKSQMIVSKEPERAYPILWGEEYLIVETQHKKWLFYVQKNDSSIILTEQYEKPNSVIILKPIIP